MPDLFPPRAVIAMIHVPALPGTPKNQLTVPQIIKHVVRDAATCHAAGAHAVLVENMHDRPFLKGRVGPEIVSSMSVITSAVKEAFSGPVGVQVLAGANQEALAVALASGADFIRVEGFVFGHLADEGWLEGDAATLLRHRKAWGAEHIQIFADVKKKHAAHALTSDVSLADTVRAVSFFHADGVIVTGTATGEETSPNDVIEARSAGSLPVLVGSGVSAQNVARFFPAASGIIVGSFLKASGDCTQPIQRKRLEHLLRAVQTASDG
jgi:membrane complex biogenesis BtpA family protein